MAKYTMNELKEEYGNFASPVFLLKINGKKIDDKYCRGEIEVSLSADYEASGCTILIYNAFFDEKNNSIKVADDLKSIKLGSKIEVSLGYRGANSITVFMGYIDSLSLEYEKEEGAVYRIDCLDGKGIMMNSMRSQVKVSLKKYSDAVESTIKKYGALIKIDTFRFDKSDSEVGVPIEQHNESDYHFVVRLARKMGYCFYIDCGNLVFQPFSKLSKEVFFEFNINYYVLSFQMETTLKGQVSEVKVRSNNEKDPKTPFEAKVNTGKGIADNASIKMKNVNIITSDVTQTIIDFSALSLDAAQKIAQAKYDELSFGRYKGKIKTLGIPVLVAGKIVKISGFGEEFDKKYYIKKVKHKITNGKYTTECELEGNQI